jgi:hypothetical protein
MPDVSLHVRERLEEVMRTLITCTLSIVLAHYAGLAAQSGPTQNASGRVTVVTAESVTIQTSKEALTLAVDSATKVIGKGVGTLTAQLKAQGRSAVVTDLVHQYDSVHVKYTTAERGPRATEIRIVVPGARKP